MKRYGSSLEAETDVPAGFILDDEELVSDETAMDSMDSTGSMKCMKYVNDVKWLNAGISEEKAVVQAVKRCGTVDDGGLLENCLRELDRAERLERVES